MCKDAASSGYYGGQQREALVCIRFVSSGWKQFSFDLVERLGFILDEATHLDEALSVCYGEAFILLQFGPISYKG
jgi:hypothetical protein